MDLWVIWLVVALVLAVGEMATAGFFLAPFAVAAGFAAGLALVGLGAALSLVGFVLAAGLAFGFVRPIARRHTQMPPQIRTGTAALVGTSGLVVARTDRDAGQVKLGGQVWSARTYLEDDPPIDPGQRVQVVEIRGATALVSE